VAFFGKGLYGTGRISADMMLMMIMKHGHNTASAKVMKNNKTVFYSNSIWQLIMKR
jgi:hypothetical protein